MAESITYIRNRFVEYDRKEVIRLSLETLDRWRKMGDKQPNPKWVIFFIMRWAFTYSQKGRAKKPFNIQQFDKLASNILNCNPDFVSKHLKGTAGLPRFFLPLKSQQFYYQFHPNQCYFAFQLKIFSITRGKYSCEKSFLERTGLSIKAFLKLCQILLLIALHHETKNKKGITLSHLMNDESADIAKRYVSIEDYRKFINLLSFSLDDAAEKITSYYPKVQDLHINLYETSFMVFYPFLKDSNRSILVDSGLLSYTCITYIYDFLKSNDKQFADHFGHIFERYIKVTFQCVKGEIWDETRIKQNLPEKSKVCDFYVTGEGIFVECKASELSSVTSVIPTEQRIIGSLKSSFLKAYFEQLLPNATLIAPEKENWGIILTYKEFLWGTFKELYEIAKDEFPPVVDTTCLPPENVFIVDLYNWHRLLKICEVYKTTISSILKESKQKNYDIHEAKMMFAMHLDSYELDDLRFDFLQEEIDAFDLEKE